MPESDADRGTQQRPEGRCRDRGVEHLPRSCVPTGEEPHVGRRLSPPRPNPDRSGTRTDQIASFVFLLSKGARAYSRRHSKRGWGPIRTRGGERCSVTTVSPDPYLSHPSRSVESGAAGRCCDRRSPWSAGTSAPTSWSSDVPSATTRPGRPPHLRRARDPGRPRGVGFPREMAELVRRPGASKETRRSSGRPRASAGAACGQPGRSAPAGKSALSRSSASLAASSSSLERVGRAPARSSSTSSIES